MCNGITRSVAYGSSKEHCLLSLDTSLVKVHRWGFATNFTVAISFIYIMLGYLFLTYKMLSPSRHGCASRLVLHESSGQEYNIHNGCYPLTGSNPISQLLGFEIRCRILIESSRYYEGLL